MRGLEHLKVCTVETSFEIPACEATSTFSRQYNVMEIERVAKVEDLDFIHADNTFFEFVEVYAIGLQPNDLTLLAGFVLKKYMIGISFGLSAEPPLSIEMADIEIDLKTLSLVEYNEFISCCKLKEKLEKDIEKYRNNDTLYRFYQREYMKYIKHFCSFFEVYMIRNSRKNPIRLNQVLWLFKGYVYRTEPEHSLWAVKRFVLSP